MRVGIIRARFNEDVTEGLLEGARDALLAAHVDPDHIIVVEVPGSLEIPVAASVLLEKRELDAVIALGCIMKGETQHDEFIANALYPAMTRLSMHTGVPVTMGVLTVNTKEQALARSGKNDENRGREAALSALEMVASLRRIKKE